MISNDILTIREVADLLKINDKTAYKLAASGELPGFKVGGSWRFRESDIGQWINDRVDVRGKERGHNR